MDRWYDWCSAEDIGITEFKVKTSRIFLIVVDFEIHFNKKINDKKYICMLIFFSHFTFDNDDMKSSKRQVTFLSLIFLLEYFWRNKNKLIVIALDSR